MDLKIDIDPKQVEAAVKDAIIKSSIGKMIEDKVKSATQDYSLTKAVEDVLLYFVTEHVRDLIRQDEALAARLKAKIVEKLDDAFIDGIAEKIARAAQRDY